MSDIQIARIGDTEFGSLVFNSKPLLVNNSPVIGKTNDLIEHVEAMVSSSKVYLDLSYNLLVFVCGSFAVTVRRCSEPGRLQYVCVGSCGLDNLEALSQLSYSERQIIVADILGDSYADRHVPNSKLIPLLCSIVCNLDQSSYFNAELKRIGITTISAEHLMYPHSDTCGLKIDNSPVVKAYNRTKSGNVHEETNIGKMFGMSTVGMASAIFETEKRTWEMPYLPDSNDIQAARTLSSKFLNASDDEPEAFKVLETFYLDKAEWGEEDEDFEDEDFEDEDFEDED